MVFNHQFDKFLFYLKEKMPKREYSFQHFYLDYFEI